MVSRRVRCRSSSGPSAARAQVEGPPAGRGRRRGAASRPARRRARSPGAGRRGAAGSRRVAAASSAVSSKRAVPAAGVLEERPHARLPLEGGQVVGVPRGRQRLEADDVLAAGVQGDPRGDQHAGRPARAGRAASTRSRQASATCSALSRTSSRRGVGQGGGDVDGGGRLGGDDAQAERRDHGLDDAGGVLDGGEVHHDGVDLVALGDARRRPRARAGSCPPRRGR